MPFKKWVLDVTNPFPDCAIFCPYDTETDTVITGLSMITKRCPGELIGIFHSGGQEAAEQWCAENPDWRKVYSK